MNSASVGLVALALALTLIVPGCFDGPRQSSTSPTSSASSISLSDLNGCNFTSSDGVAIDCKDVSRKLELGPNPSLSDGWVCIDRGGGPPSKARILVWYHRLRDELAVQIQTEEYAGSKVVANFKNQRPTDIYRWTLNSKNDTVRIPSPPPQDELSILIYKAWIENESAQLKGAPLEQIWARAENFPYPIQRLNAPGGPYYFQTVLRFTDESNRTLVFDMLPGKFSGTDFEFSFRYEKVARAGFNYNVDGIFANC